MLNVKTPKQALKIIKEQFSCLEKSQSLPLSKALGKVLYEDIAAHEFVPDFDRSSVDGYAVKAQDTFGCSFAIPAIFPLQGEVIMGRPAPDLKDGHCMYVPTGGAIPKNANAVVMIEYSEDYGDNTVGLTKPAAPGHNIVFRGDDVSPGKIVIKRGKKLQPQDLGSLAALGFTKVLVAADIKVGVISTGDELVSAADMPAPGQVRDINSVMVSAVMLKSGCEVKCYDIVKDEERLLRGAAELALLENDLVLISGGSSVGVKDATAKVIAGLGEILLHGIAIKPGKPTIIGKAGAKALIGLPGHPAAAFFICHLFVRPLIWQLQGRRQSSYLLPARLTEAISANDGRTQYISVSLQQRPDGIYALPLRAKSSQITNLAATAGYICIPRDAEGLAAGSIVEVALYSGD